MTIIFKYILGMTLVGSMLSMLILAITPITKKIFSSRWHIYSRIAVLSFFLLPIGTVAAKSFEKITHMLLRSGSPILSDFWQEIPAPLAITAFNAETQANTFHGGILESILAFLPYIWFAGTVLFLLLKLLQLVRFKRLVSKSSEQISDRAVLDVFEEVKKHMQIHGHIELIANSVISTPMLIGFSRTQLILPKSDLSENELKLVFRHELTHYRHGDLWVKLAATIACAVHWFNPFVYLLANSLDKFLEMSCDAEVVKNMDYEERRDYGAAMLDVLGSTAGNQTSIYAAFSSSQKNMIARLTAMLNEKKQSKKATVISIFAMLLICVAGISVSAATHKDTRVIEALTYTPINESQNPLDYVEVERPANQEKVIGAPDEVSEPQYASSAPAEIGTPQYDVGGPLDSNASGYTLVGDGYVVRVTKEQFDQFGQGEFSDFDLDRFVERFNLEKIYDEETQPILTSFLWPTDDGGYISAGVGTYEGHTGMDITVPKDTPVYASNAGWVVRAVNSNVGYGRHIVIDHGDGYQTVYAHCNSLDVAVGDMVEAGQTIAAVGRTGNATGHHLHFEVRYNGRIMNPEDYVDVENSTVELPQ